MKLEDMMKNAIINDVDELDFFMEVLEQGFTLENFKETKYYGYAKNFMEEHGLIDSQIDLSTFVLAGNNREEAYNSHIEFEKGFPSYVSSSDMSFEEFCVELDNGYGNSDYIQIARLYEDSEGRIWYDNEYCG